MGISRGTNIVRDSLVFGFDTGYSVADNNTATRFYPGKPTTNLLSSTEAFDDTNYWARSRNSGSVPTVTANTSPNPLGGTYTSKADKVYIPDDGTYPRVAQNFTPASTNTHTFSVWIRSLSGDCRIYLIAFRNSPWNVSGAAHKNLTSEWQRVSFSFTPLDASSHQIYMGAHDDAADKGNTLEFWGAHMEQNPEATPYEASSRSNTTSLIDLKRTRDISVANISFEGTGQPDFDGTDDFIAITDLLASQSIGSNTQLTISLWLNQDSYGSRMPFSTGQSGADRIYYWTQNSLNTWRVGNYTSTTGHGTLPSVGEWYNTVLVISGNNVTVYLNGAEDYTGTYTSFTTENYATFGRHGATSAYYYNGNIGAAKIYEKALSAAEVTQNFNAYKKRFNL